MTATRTRHAPRVLVVDDDVKLAGIVARALERAGYGCVVADSGDQALWAANAHHPDALVLDVMIPHPSGVEVCRHLRVAGFAGPIVVISARSRTDDRAAARRAGADAFMAKPFALSDLVSSLDALVGRGAVGGDTRRVNTPTRDHLQRAVGSAVEQGEQVVATSRPTSGTGECSGNGSPSSTSRPW